MIKEKYESLKKYISPNKYSCIFLVILTLILILITWKFERAYFRSFDPLGMPLLSASPFYSYYIFIVIFFILITTIYLIKLNLKEKNIKNSLIMLLFPVFILLLRSLEGLKFLNVIQQQYFNKFFNHIAYSSYLIVNDLLIVSIILVGVFIYSFFILTKRIKIKVEKNTNLTKRKKIFMNFKIYLLTFFASITFIGFWLYYLF